MGERQIVVGIDGSDQAERAFQFYIENLHQKQNKLILIHAAEPPALSSQHAMVMSGELFTQMMDAEKERVKELENKFAEIMKTHNIAGKIKAVFSYKPGEVIIETAKEEKVDMIVMGTRGLGKVRRTLMGSVSDYVVHHAHCPVVICRE